MPSEAELKRWVLKKAFERFGAERTAEFYAGQAGYDANGLDGVKKALFTDLLPDLYQSQTQHGRAARGFNALADDWPRPIRSILAGFEYRNRQENDDFDDVRDDYKDELQFLAEQHDALEMTFEQTDLSCFYEDNPFEDERLSDEEARVVLLLRTTDQSISNDIIEDISDFDSFKARLDETDDVEKAISAHLYGDELPIEVTRPLPPPTEWPDELDPQDVEGENCLVCGNTLFEVYTEYERIEYVDDGGRTCGCTDVTHDDDSVYYPTSQYEDHGIVCDRCSTNLADEATEWVRVGNGNLTCIQWGQNIYKDEAVENGIYTPFNSVEDSLFNALIRGVYDEDRVVNISPNPDVANRDQQEELLSEIKHAHVEEAIGEDIFYIKHEIHPIQGHSWEVVIDRTDLDSARKAKSMLEAPEEFIEA